MENKETYTKDEVRKIITAYRDFRWQIEELGRNSLHYGIEETRKGILASLKRFEENVPSDFNSLMDVNPSKLEKKFN